MGAPTFISEITLRSRKRNQQYCLLPEERNPFGKNPQQILVFGTSEIYMNIVRLILGEKFIQLKSRAFGRKVFAS